jgi:hypothetical protein
MLLCYLLLKHLEESYGFQSISRKTRQLALGNSPRKTAAKRWQCIKRLTLTTGSRLFRIGFLRNRYEPSWISGLHPDEQRNYALKAQIHNERKPQRT